MLPEGRVFAGYYGLKHLVHVSGNQNLFTHLAYVRFGLFCKSFGDFWVYLGIIAVLKGLVKFMEILKI